MLGNLLINNLWEDIWQEILKFYPEDKKYLVNYQQVFDFLKTRPVTKAKMNLCIEVRKDKYDGKCYWDVYGNNGTKDSNGRNIRYGLEFDSWEQWLGMEIDQATQQAFSEQEIIAHCLYEMTYVSFSQENIKKEAQRISQEMGNFEQSLLSGNAPHSQCIGQVNEYNVYYIGDKKQN